MNTRKVISIILIAIYGMLITHQCAPAHAAHHVHHIEANSIFIDNDGCLVHSEDGKHECHHHDENAEHQHSAEYIKSDTNKTLFIALGDSCLSNTAPTPSHHTQSKQKHYYYKPLFSEQSHTQTFPTRGSPKC